MDEDRLGRALLTGSAAQRRPVGDCRCPNCLLAGKHPAPADPGDPGDPAGPGDLAGDHRTWSRPSGLLLPGVLAVDGDSADVPRLTTVRPTGDPPTGDRWLAAGDRAQFDGVRVVALPAGTATGEPDPDRVVLVLGSGPRAILWAAGGGPLPEVTVQALHGADLVAAVLNPGTAPPGRSPGRSPDRAAGGIGDTDLGLGLAHQVARLRRVGALADSARLVAAGLPHDGPTPARLAALATAWDVTVLPDGTSLLPGPSGATPASHVPTSHGPALPRRTVVLGAAGSGKSAVAETLLAALPDVIYLATGPQPDDADPGWAARVAAHRARRPAWWQTVESGELVELLTRPGPPLLVDSLGTWLADAMTDAGCWDERSGWQDRLQQRVDAVVAAWCQAARPVVAVAEEVGWGVVPATPSGGRFRDALGRLNRRICDRSERVLLVVAGRPVDLDGPGAGIPGPGTTVREGLG